MEIQKRILVINPGSTSTKIGVFDHDYCVFEKTIRHQEEDLLPYERIMEQYEYRKNVVLQALREEGINISKFDAICGRGGLLRPIQGGTYQVNDQMLLDLKMGYNGDHASNLGGIIAHSIASGLNIPAYIVDPVVVDEMDDIARISGIPEIPRKSIFHALNQKAVARKAAIQLGKKYEDVQLLVAHMGGGISVGAHKYGKVIDVNNALDGDGPFSPERAGTVPAGDLITQCFSGTYDQDTMMRKIVGDGGLWAHLHTKNITEVEELIEQGDERASLIFSAMAYQVAKEIGSMSIVLDGKVDAIVLTGGIAHASSFTTMIQNRVDWIADVFIYPGENELESLAQGTLRVLMGEEHSKQYEVAVGEEENNGNRI